LNVKPYFLIIYKKWCGQMSLARQRLALLSKLVRPTCRKIIRTMLIARSIPPEVVSLYAQ